MAEPERMCVICRKRLPKTALLRHVAAEGGALVADERQIMPGRGYYVCAACQARFAGFRPRGRAKAKKKP